MTKHQHRERIARSISWGHWFTFSNIFLALLIGALYFNSASTTGNLLARVYLVVSWLGHFAFLPFVVFILLIFPFCLAFPYSRFLRGLGATVASFGLFALLFDAIFFQFYQFHLNTYALAQLATDAEAWVTGGSFLILIATILIFLLIFAVQLVLTNITWKKLERLRQLRSFKVLPSIFVAAFFLSHLMHIWADATLFKPITQQDDLFPLSYPSTAKSLMTRHGWIDLASLGQQHEHLSDAKIRLRYPQSPLLCARKPHASPSVFILFDQLSKAQLAQIKLALPELDEFQGQLLGHPDTAAALFQFAYAIPDRYLSLLNQRNLAPAYLSTLDDFGYPLQWQSTQNFPTELLPTALQALTTQVQPLNANANITTGRPGITTLLAQQSDFAHTLSFLQQLVTLQPKAAIYITALSPLNAALPTTDEESTSPIASRLAVPLLTQNVAINSQRLIAQTSDLMPSALHSYMSCAEGSRSYSNALLLTAAHTGYPLVKNIEPNIYLFESRKTSVLNALGEVKVYDNAGKLLEGAQPTPTALIQALNELQRFSSPERKQ